MLCISSIFGIFYFNFYAILALLIDRVSLFTRYSVFQ